MALGVGWVGGWGWGVIGGCPPHMCTHMHMHTCTRGKHDNFMQMAAPIGGIPWNSLVCHTRVRAHASMHVHVHVGGMHPLTTPHPHPPTPYPPGWGTPGIIQNSIALELIKIFQFCLKI